MAKGENIFRRRDGRWEARYIKGRELSGKIKYADIHATNENAGCWKLAEGGAVLYGEKERKPKGSD